MSRQTASSDARTARAKARACPTPVTPIESDRRHQPRIAEQHVDLTKVLRQSRTPTGNTSSHNNSTCPATKRNTQTSKIVHKHTHLQANHPAHSGQNRPPQRRLFPGQVARSAGPFRGSSPFRASLLKRYGSSRALTLKAGAGTPISGGDVRVDS